MITAADGSAFTGSVTVHVTGDGGTQATGSVGSGACTHEGNGFHTYAPAQAETNYDHVAFTFTGTGAIPATVQVYTTFPQSGDNFARLGSPAGASVSADIAAVKAQTAAIETDTAEIGTAGAGLTNINLPNQTMDIVGNITGNLSGSVGSVTAGVTLAASAVQAIWDGLTSALTTVGSIGKLLVDNINATISSRSSHSASDVWAVATRLLTAGTNIVLAKGTGVTGFNDLSAAQVNSEVDTALADIHLDHLLANTYDPASKPGAADALLNELVEDDGGVARFTANSLEQAPTGGSAPTASEIADEVETREHILTSAYDAAKTAASQTSVNDLPTNAELATALAAADDAVLAAIAALNNLSQANIRTAIGLASANLDTQLGDIPTNAELATALDAADDAVLAAIAALNNLSQANVRSAVGLASANLDTQLADLPTNSELATALAAADDAVLAAIAALNNPSSTQIRDAVWAKVIESAGSITAQQLLQVILAVLAGVTTDGGATIKTPDGSATRVAATINVSNERTGMVLTP